MMSVHKCYSHSFKTDVTYSNWLVGPGTLADNFELTLFVFQTISIPMNCLEIPRREGK